MPSSTANTASNRRIFSSFIGSNLVGWWRPLLRQAVIPREGEEDGDADLGLNGVGQLVLAVPSGRIAGRGPHDRLRVLELVEEDVVSHFEHGGKPAVEEDAQTEADVERSLRTPPGKGAVV